MSTCSIYFTSKFSSYCNSNIIFFKYLINLYNAYTNSLTIKLDFNDNIDWSDVEKTSSEVTSFITLKQFETVVDENKNISYYEDLDTLYFPLKNEKYIGTFPISKIEIIDGKKWYYLEEVEYGLNANVINTLSNLTLSKYDTLKYNNSLFEIVYNLPETITMLKEPIIKVIYNFRFSKLLTTQKYK